MVSPPITVRNGYSGSEDDLSWTLKANVLTVSYIDRVTVSRKICSEIDGPKKYQRRKHYKNAGFLKVYFDTKSTVTNFMLSARKVYIVFYGGVL